jgi:hypothetical protein
VFEVLIVIKLHFGTCFDCLIILWASMSDRTFSEFFIYNFSLVTETTCFSILEQLLCLIGKCIDFMLSPGFQIDLQFIIDKADDHSLLEWNQI